jgi:hypothetical protein
LYKFIPSSSNTIITCCLNLKSSTSSTILFCPSLSSTSFFYNFFRILISTKALSTSNFLFLEILTATVFGDLDLQSRHLRTYPNAPWSILACTTYL